MEPATTRLAAPGRVQAALLAALIALAVLAWLATANRMAGTDMGPGTDLGTLGFFVISWVVMMAAMMFPSITPMVLVFARIESQRRQRGATEEAVSTWIFVAGYLLVWTAFGLLAYGVFAAAQALSIDALAWDRAGRWVAAGVIAAAALYELTPAKDACLRRCRGPLDFLMERWREGRAGALLMGIEHGAWCAGCCWGLMAALFALGVMSVGWMVLIAGLIAVEKTLPWKAVANYGVAVVLLVLALAVAAVPEDVPGLTVPGSMDSAPMDSGSGHSGSMEKEMMKPAEEPTHRSMPMDR
jgi:predicted metal-binding membrane protein